MLLLRFGFGFPVYDERPDRRSRDTYRLYFVVWWLLSGFHLSLVARGLVIAFSSSVLGP